MTESHGTPSNPLPRDDVDFAAMARLADERLLSACLAGDGRAWETIVDRYSRLVYSVARRCGLGDADCEDVHQAVFLLMYRKLHTLREAARLSSWLLTTTYREAWRVSRRKAFMHGGDVEFLAEIDGPTTDDLEREERRQMVRQALSMLGGQGEKLLTALLSARGTVSYDAIARDLGMRVGSIGPTRARCFRKLEKILRELGFDDGGEEMAFGEPEAEAMRRMSE